MTAHQKACEVPLIHLLQQPCDVAPEDMGCIWRAVAGAAGQGIKRLPNAQEHDKRGSCPCGRIPEQPIVHCFSTDAQQQQQHEVRDEAAG